MLRVKHTFRICVDMTKPLLTQCVRSGFVFFLRMPIKLGIGPDLWAAFYPKRLRDSKQDR